MGGGRVTIAVAPACWGILAAIWLRRVRWGILPAMLLHAVGTAVAIYGVMPWTGLSDLAHAARPEPLQALAPGALLLPVIAGALAGYWEQER